MGMFDFLKKKKNVEEIGAPIEGMAVASSEVPDPTFAEEMLGKGIAIKPAVGKVYAPDEFDKNIWTVEGEPTTTITVEKPATVELTCGTIVNRIPDVINAPAGYVTTEKMGDLYFKGSNLEKYVK